jgi:hypothetical protein
MEAIIIIITAAANTVDMEVEVRGRLHTLNCAQPNSLQFDSISMYTNT